MAKKLFLFDECFRLQQALRGFCAAHPDMGAFFSPFFASSQTGSKWWFANWLAHTHTHTNRKRFLSCANARRTTTPVSKTTIGMLVACNLCALGVCVCACFLPFSGIPIVHPTQQHYEEKRFSLPSLRLSGALFSSQHPSAVGNYSAWSMGYWRSHTHNKDIHALRRRCRPAAATSASSIDCLNNLAHDKDSALPEGCRCDEIGKRGPCVTNGISHWTAL